MDEAITTANKWMVDQTTWMTTNNESNSTGDGSQPDETPCDRIAAVSVLHQLFCIGISVVIIICLGFTIRRKTRWPNCCWGRPGFAQPINFIDEVQRRWAYAACFVIITYSVLDLFLGGDIWGSFMPKTDKEWMSKFGWVRVFVKFGNALTVCLIYYPLLACIDHRRSIASNVLGILYTIPFIVIRSMTFSYCPFNGHEGPVGLFASLSDLPVYAAYYVVVFSYVLDMVRNILQKQNTRNKVNIVSEAKRNIDEYKITHHYDYVEKLIEKKALEESDTTKTTFKMKIMNLVQRAKYRKITGFRYSTRLICSITVGITLLIWLEVYLGIILDLTIAQPCRDFCNNDLGEFRSLFFVIDMLCDGINTTMILVHVANALAGMVILILIINTLVTYRRRWHQLLKGDHSWHAYGSTIAAPPNTLLTSLKFAGYQAAYVVWGWAVLLIVLWLVLMFFAFAVIVPLKLGKESWVINKLKDLWPTILLGVIILPLVQKLITRFCFLQDQGKVMAIDNRRIFHATSYYFLILNVVIGFFSCLKRILIPLVLGILFLSRLDQPLIMHGFEKFDPGYASFVAMLLVDLYHNHPVIKVFVDLLQQVKENRQSESNGRNHIGFEKIEISPRWKLARNRWIKAVTLLNNPTLVLENLEKHLREDLKQRNLLKQQNSSSPDKPNNVIQLEAPLSDYDEKKLTIFV